MKRGRPRVVRGMKEETVKLEVKVPASWKEDLEEIGRYSSISSVIREMLAEYLGKNIAPLTRTRTREEREEAGDCPNRRQELESLLDQIDPSWRDDGGDRRHQICLNDIQKAIYYQHGYKDPRTARSYARALQMAGYVSHHVGEVYNINHR
jgi:Arc/MetJ-type ribon-helix-helix transcriptional regulator